MEIDKIVLKTHKKDCGGCSTCTSVLKAEAESLLSHFKDVTKQEG
ncbi:MAG: hypothetical protein ABSA75_03610 [Candidatus Bathyarchaeia archaeon]